MKTKAVIIAAFLLSVFFGAGLAQAEEYTIKMVSKGDRYAFEPDTLSIKSGDTVTWINATDDVEHDVMSEGVPKGAETFTSPPLKKAGEKWSYTFKTSGTYNYHCHPHNDLGMKGSIIVDHPSETAESHGHDHADSASDKITAEQAMHLMQENKPVYSCPMHTNYFSSHKDGKCPFCGMHLSQVKEIKNNEAVFESDQMDTKVESK